MAPAEVRASLQLQLQCASLPLPEEAIPTSQVGSKLQGKPSLVSKLIVSLLILP